jgi:hypothetical protein
MDEKREGFVICDAICSGVYRLCLEACASRGLSRFCNFANRNLKVEAERVNLGKGDWMCARLGQRDCYGGTLGLGASTTEGVGGVCEQELLMLE